VHELDLLFDHLAAIVVVSVRGAVEIEVLRVDRLFVDQLVLLGGEVFEPVVPLRVGAELAQRVYVDRSRDPGGSGAVVVPPDNLPAVVDNERAAAERIDGDVGVGVQVIRPDIARDQVQVVVQGAGAVLHLEQAVADVRVRIRPTVDHLRAVHRQAASVLRI